MTMNSTGDRNDAPWLRRGQMPSFDGLRGVGMLFVLLSHVQESRGFPHVPVLSQLAAGVNGFGVNLFFIVTGFLITVLLLREFERDGRVGLKNFYLRRLLRIVPAYVCLLVVVAILQIA